jgi:heme exporter protein CcmD
VTDAGYVIAAWSLTAVVLGGYTVWLARRVRRAERDQDQSEREG